MPFITRELNVANRPANIAARTAIRTARAAVLRARWLKLGGEPADFDLAEADLVKRDMEARFLSPTAWPMELESGRDAPEQADAP